MPVIRYQLEHFPKSANDLDLFRLMPLVEQASLALARYDGSLKALPNPDLFSIPLVLQEATVSSRIEGTQATFDEVLEQEAWGIEPDQLDSKSQDIKEIQNYRKALHMATKRLDTLPLSQRLFKEMHVILLDSVRGKNKSPGEYRKIPNWIGSPGSTIETARFVPCGVEHLTTALDRWEGFIHEDSNYSKLIQLAIIHAEFEAIHPFLDGNGRLGRLVIPLFLKEKGLLSHPFFYMSAFFDAHRDEYYDRLLCVSSIQDWTGWSEFFLRGILHQAKANEKKINDSLHLYQTVKNQLADIKYHSQALDWLFAKPTFKTTDFIETSGIPSASAKRLLKRLLDSELLVEIRPASGRRPALLRFKALFDILATES